MKVKIASQGTKINREEYMLKVAVSAEPSITMEILQDLGLVSPKLINFWTNTFSAVASSMGLFFGILQAIIMLRPVFNTSRRAIPKPVLSDAPPSTEVTLTVLLGRVGAAAYRFPNLVELQPIQT